MVQKNTAVTLSSTPLEVTLFFEFEQVFLHYEEKIICHLSKGEIKNTETILMDFCSRLIPLNKDEQLFTTKLFFTDLVMTIIRRQAEKERLSTNVIAKGYELIAIVESWETISEYMLHISSFVQYLITHIIVDHLFYRGNPKLEEALLYIYEHLHDKSLSVTSIANKLNISTTHLTNLFKNHYGINASQYIAQKKVAAIIKQLKYSNDSLHNIRKQFGFSNHSHFIQYFKKHCGLTPLQYLQKHVY